MAYHTRRRGVQVRGAWHRSAHGFALITTLLLLLLLSTSITTAMVMSGLQSRITRNLQNGHQARYLAEAGIQQALYQLRRNAQWRQGIAQTTFGPGAYSVTVTQTTPGADITLIATGKAAGAQRTTTVRLRPIIITVAGTGSNGYTGNGGKATAATLKQPAGVFVDALGRLFIADEFNHTVRLVTPGADGIVNGGADEIISTVAGTGQQGSTGNNGPATSARLKNPQSLWVDSQGNLFIVDSLNHRVRRVGAGADGIVTGAADEIMSDVAGSNAQGYTGDGGPATSGRLKKPSGFFFEVLNNMYIADTQNSVVRRVTPGVGGIFTGANDEIISTVAGTGIALPACVAGVTTVGNCGDGGLPKNANIEQTQAIWASAQGNMYLVHTNHHRIRWIMPGVDLIVTNALDELIFTVAGNGIVAYGGDGGLPTLGNLKQPTGIAGDASGNIYIADAGNHRIRQVIPGADGIVNGSLDERLYTVVGDGTGAFKGDGGAAIAAQVKTPGSVYIDPNGNLYIADSANNRIRKVVLRIMRWETS